MCASEARDVTEGDLPPGQRPVARLLLELLDQRFLPGRSLLPLAAGVGVQPEREPGGQAAKRRVPQARSFRRDQFVHEPGVVVGQGRGHVVDDLAAVRVALAGGEHGVHAGQPAAQRE
jgi:hypothetical protein